MVPGVPVDVGSTSDVETGPEDPGASVVPQVVADWNAGVYGIGGAKVLAGGALAVAGTFNVSSVSTSDVET